MKRFFTAAVLATFAFVAMPMAANASILITVTESGGNVIFTATGSLDLTGATSLGVLSYEHTLIAGGSNWFIGPGGGSPRGLADRYALTTFDGPFGTSTSGQKPDSSTGDDFYIWSGATSTGIAQVGVPLGYVSGSAIDSQMVFNGATIAGLTMIPGIYNYAIPNDTIVLNIRRNDVVPEPGTTLIWTVLAGTGLVVSTRRRRLAV